MNNPLVDQQQQQRLQHQSLDSRTSTATTNPQNNPALIELEAKLQRDVDEEFFQDPKSFRTLNRVIDVLGSQLLDRHTGGGVRSGSANLYSGDLQHNPTYLALKRQQDIVEDAIEYMATRHCADLNQSVVAVGKVARELTSAVDQVQSLRRQVRDVKASLGGTDQPLTPRSSSNHPNRVTFIDLPHKNNNHNGGTSTTENNNFKTVSLRELWLKKLECEAVISLLGKLQIIRDAPVSFDSLIQPRSGPCRVAAAVLLLMNAIDTMFSDDVAQIQALTKLSEQLMARKQRAEEIVWDALHDVVYLRTAMATDSNVVGSRGHGSMPAKRVLPFSPHSTLLEDDDNSDDGTASSVTSDGDDNNTVATCAFTTVNYNANHPYRMIPLSTLKEELHLEQDELQCLEEVSSHSNTTSAPSTSLETRIVPKYTDATMASRILIEALARLGRLDDVERYLVESLGRELRRIAELEQARTFAQLEKRRIQRLRNRQGGMMGHADLQRSKERPLRLHLNNLLSAFENVMLRLSHLAQILRHRIVSIILRVFEFLCVVGL